VKKALFPVLAAAAALAAAGAEPTPLEQVAARLPPDVGAAALRWFHENDKDFKAYLALSPAELESDVMVSLASEPGAADFVLGRLPKEPFKVDQLVIKVMVVDEFWVGHPGTLETLHRLATQARDPGQMLAFLEAERRLGAKGLRGLVTSRIAEARSAGDQAALRTLAAADENWAMLVRGAAMPAFMRRPPPPFPAWTGPSVRVVGMGDFGTGASAQREVAAAIVAMGRGKPFNLGLTFGDNFYPSGMNGTDDPRWRDWWEDLYGPLGITFYPCLGNHEWYSEDGAAAEIAYRSPTWRFPSPYYTFTGGPVQFFAVDTTDISEEQVMWLDSAIRSSTARWKVVYGHHPIFAPEWNGKAGAYLQYMQARLWPILRGRVDAYLCGHQHAMARMEPRDGVHFFMSGGGGGSLSRVAKNAPGAVFAESNFGFLTLDADDRAMTIAIFDAQGRPYSSETVAR
jgi:tartrate-resistant acid phosphatase type 5